MASPDGGYGQAGRHQEATPSGPALPGVLDLDVP